MSQEYISALQKHDRKILEKARQAPRELPKEIDKQIANLDDEARELSIEFVAMQDSDIPADICSDELMIQARTSRHWQLKK